MTKERKSNFELLRIILILMIIILHYFNAEMGGSLGHTTPGTLNYYLSHLLESLSIIAVNVFILITGYFSYRKNTVQISKIVKLTLDMIFWGLLLSILTVLYIRPQSFSVSIIRKIIFSATDQWFVVIYCILYMLIPYLNLMIGKLNKGSFRILIVIGVFFFYVWPSFYSSTPDNDNGYGIINFVFLYFIGAYIKIYADKNNIFKSFLGYLICAIVVTLLSFKTEKVWNYNFICNLFGSVFFFYMFKSMYIPHNKIINYLATYTFAVYLIDVNAFFNLYLYRILFHSNKYWNNDKMILNLIITVLGIYIICIILESVRRLIFGKLFNWLVGNVTLSIKV